PAPTTPTCRWDASGSAATSRASASAAGRPPASRSSARGPYPRFDEAWVAIAPTPARAHGAARPTASVQVATATPSCPLPGSRATSENVIRRAGPSAGGGRDRHLQRRLVDQDRRLGRPPNVLDAHPGRQLLQHQPVRCDVQYGQVGDDPLYARLAGQRQAAVVHDLVAAVPGDV